MYYVYYWTKKNKLIELYLDLENSEKAKKRYDYLLSLNCWGHIKGLNKERLRG